MRKSAPLPPPLFANLRRLKPPAAVRGPLNSYRTLSRFSLQTLHNTLSLQKNPTYNSESWAFSELQRWLLSTTQKFAAIVVQWKQQRKCSGSGRRCSCCCLLTVARRCLQLLDGSYRWCGYRRRRSSRGPLREEEVGSGGRRRRGPPLPIHRHPRLKQRFACCYGQP